MHLVTKIIPLPFCDPLRFYAKCQLTRSLYDLSKCQYAIQTNFYYLHRGGQYGLEYCPVEDRVAHADQRDDHVLAEQAGDVGRDLVPKVGEEVRNLWGRIEEFWVLFLQPEI